MNHVTKLTILLKVYEGECIAEVVSELPGYCASTFANTGGNHWYGEFQISCPVAPELADGDFGDDFAPYFPALLRLKTLKAAEYQLVIAVGAPADEFFELKSHSVALLSALGASIVVQTAQGTSQIEQATRNKVVNVAGVPDPDRGVSQP